MLHGRAQELERIEALLDGARSGRSGALLLSGEPGIGKSALLAAARDRAEGLRTLEGRGFESERDIPFAGLHALLGEVAGLRDRIPEVQARALGTALAVEPPSPHDPYAVPAAVLSLLGAAAEEGPLLAVVDDLQWLDPPSLRALAFAARRLRAEGVALLLAAREEPALEPAVAGIPRLAVGRLDDAAARAVVREHAGRLPEAVTEALVQRAGGNPLALRELPVALSEAERSGSEPLAARLPPGSGVEQAFGQRLAGLDAAGRRALTVVAAFEGGPLHVALPALEALGLSLAELERGEAAGLLVLARGEVRFRHPVLRSLALHAAPAAERREAHRALAGASRDPAARAWHLAAAALGPDEEVARALDLAAGLARGRGAPGEAAAAALRAADLSATDAARLARLTDAAAGLVEAGRAQEALVPLERAAALPADPERAAALRALRARVEVQRGALAEGRALLVAEAALLHDTDPATAAGLHLEAGFADLVLGSTPGMLEDSDRALALADGAAPHVAALARLLRGVALVPVGRAPEAAPLLDEAVPLLLHGDLPPGTTPIAAFGAQVLMWLERRDTAEAIVARQIEAARRQSALGLLVFPLAVRAMLNQRRGRFAAALADASESADLAEETGQGALLPFILGTLSRVETATGRLDAAHAHAERGTELLARIGGGPSRIYTEAARGAVALVRGEHDEAAARCAAATAASEALGGVEPAIAQEAGDLLEGLVRAGRRDDARAEADRLADRAQATGRAWAHAVVERARAQLAAPADVDAHLARALEHHRRAGQPLETARTQLAVGERLRRDDRRDAARDVLAPAVEAFARLGAEPWAERARAELRAAGRTVPRPRTGEGAAALTPSELQVAQKVAEGLTNREVAAALFLAPKTVEHHLSTIYRKLGLRSRGELAALLAEGDAPVAA